MDFGSENKFTKKIREGQNIYIKKKFNKKAYQVLINTPNVMVYASKTEKCSMVSEECYEKFGNVHNPFFYEPEKEDIQVMFMIKGLDNCEFTLTLIEEGT